MANLGNITVNVSLNGPLDVEKLAEEFKASIRKEIERVGVKLEVAKPAPLRVGDYAKVIQTGHSNEGEIVEILSVDYSEHYPFDTKLINGKAGDCHRTEQLARANDEEVAEAKEKLAQKEIEAKWAEIGRKPNEFKKGDIVKLLDDTGANSIGEIVEVSKDGARWYIDEYGDEYGCSPEGVELISPVEARFDR
jgi:transcription antitermination factor NusG